MGGCYNRLLQKGKIIGVCGLTLLGLMTLNSKTVHADAVQWNADNSKNVVNTQPVRIANLNASTAVQHKVEINNPTSNKVIVNYVDLNGHAISNLGTDAIILDKTKTGQVVAPNNSYQIGGNANYQVNVTKHDSTVMDEDGIGKYQASYYIPGTGESNIIGSGQVPSSLYKALAQHFSIKNGDFITLSYYGEPGAETIGNVDNIFYYPASQDKYYRNHYENYGSSLPFDERGPYPKGTAIYKGYYPDMTGKSYMPSWGVAIRDQLSQFFHKIGPEYLKDHPGSRLIDAGLSNDGTGVRLNFEVPSHEVVNNSVFTSDSTAITKKDDNSINVTLVKPVNINDAKQISRSVSRTITVSLPRIKPAWYVQHLNKNDQIVDTLIFKRKLVKDSLTGQEIKNMSTSWTTIGNDSFPSHTLPRIPGYQLVINK